MSSLLVICVPNIRSYGLGRYYTRFLGRMVKNLAVRFSIYSVLWIWPTGPVRFLRVKGEPSKNSVRELFGNLALMTSAKENKSNLIIDISKFSEN